MKNVKKTLLEEIESILDKNDICSYMDTNISEVKYRLTPMIIGLFTDVNCKTVNTWLHRMGEEQLSPRNAFEAMFIYVYRKYSGDKVKERVKKWQHLFKTYNNTIENTLINRVPVTIETFGDLCAVLKNDSESPNEFRTFATKNYTEQVIYPKLEEFINSDEENAFEQYLLFLTEDESINSYQRKATYYLRRFLYEIIMDGIYLLYNRHQYEFTKEENQKTRKAAFSSDESFNTYITYNCICLDCIKNPKGRHSKKTLKHILDFDAKTNEIGLTYDSCKKWLSDKKIVYSSFRHSFYEIFGNYDEIPIEYQVLRSHIKKTREEPYVEPNAFITPLFQKLYSVYEIFENLCFFSVNEEAKQKEKKEKKIRRTYSILLEMLDYSFQHKNDSTIEWKYSADIKEFVFKIESEILNVANEFIVMINDYSNNILDWVEIRKISRCLDNISTLLNQREIMLQSELDDISYDHYKIIYDAFFEEKKDMPIIKPGEKYIPLEDSTFTDEFLIEKYARFEAKNNRNTYNDLVESMVVGEINVTRRMFLLLGVFAGYGYNDLNNMLLKCGFDELRKSSTFDNAIMLILKFEYIQKKKNMHNNERFLVKSSSFDTYFSDVKNADGELDSQTKEDYKEDEIKRPRTEYLKLLTQQFVLIENDTSLPTISDIFLNDRMKNILERQNKELAKINIKIKKM